MNLRENPLVEARLSPIHGQGLFARRDIAAGTRVVEYVGHILTRAQSLPLCEGGNPFIFELDERHDLDGNVPWNPARFMNHSCAANCEATLDEGGIWIVARRAIAAGEELTFNYGYDLADYREYPCRCGSPRCVGFIVAEELFEHVRRQNWMREEAVVPCTAEVLC